MTPLVRALAVAAMFGGLASAALAAAPPTAADKPAASQPAAPRSGAQTPTMMSAPTAPTPPAADGIKIESEDGPPIAGALPMPPGGDTGQDGMAQTPSTTTGKGDLTVWSQATAADKGLPSWLALVLAAGALLLGLIGTVLGVISVMERRAVQTALGNNPQLDTGEGKARLGDQVVLLLDHITRMRLRIQELEAEVTRLKGNGPSPAQDAPLPASANPLSTRKTAFFEDRRVGNPASSQDDRLYDQAPLRTPEPQAPAPQWPAPEPAPPRFSSDDAAVDDLGRSAEVREILDEYNRAASQGDRGGVQAFERRYGPVAVALVGDGSSLSRSGDDILWFVPLNAGSDYGLVLPGPGPIKNWHKVYRTMLGQQAKERFGQIYEVVEGPDLTIDTPAWAQASGSGYRRLRSGQLRGAQRT